MLKRSEIDRPSIIRILLKYEANLDVLNNSQVSPRKMIESLIKLEQGEHESQSTQLEQILMEYPEGKKAKFSKVESWLSNSIDELDDKESSIDSLQSLNDDIRALRDENLQV